MSTEIDGGRHSGRSGAAGGEVLRNEVSPDDKTDFAASPPMASTIGALGLLHFLCCGIPLLLLSGASLAAVAPLLPDLGVGLVVVGAIGFVWYLRTGCATCPGNPKRCRAGRIQIGSKQ